MINRLPRPLGGDGASEAAPCPRPFWWSGLLLHRGRLLLLPNGEYAAIEVAVLTAGQVHELPGDGWWVLSAGPFSVAVRADFAPDPAEWGLEVSP